MKGFRISLLLLIFLLIPVCCINNSIPFLLASTNINGNDLVNTDIFPSSFNQIPLPSPDNDLAHWNQTYGGLSGDAASSLIEVSTGGFLFVGSTSTWSAGSSDAWLVRLDANGNHLWNKTFGGSLSDGGREVIECSGGGFAFVGTTYSFGRGEFPDTNDVWLVRTDANGNLLWNKTYGCDVCDNGQALVECSDGGFGLLAATRIGGGDFEMGLFRTDVDGNLLWWKTYGEPFSWGSRILRVGTGFLLVGSIYSEETHDDVFVVRTDENGNIVWAKTFIGFDFDGANAVIPVSTGGFLIGCTTGFNWLFNWLIRIDDTGQHLWNATYGGIMSSTGDIVECSDGGFAIAGSIGYSGYGFDSDAFLIRIDQDGRQLWTKTYGHPDYPDRLSSLVIASSGYLMCVGSTQSYGAGEGDAWLLCIPAPLWVEEPTDHFSELGTLCAYDLNATAPDGIDHWWLNDTTDFSIDVKGVIRNASSLSLGSYPLHVVVNDTHGHELNTSLTIRIVPVSPPTWDYPPVDRTLELNSHLKYALKASDISGLDSWWLNDTAHFIIDNLGVVQNATVLWPGRYGLQVWVNDTLGEILTGTFTVIIQDTANPHWIDRPENQNLDFGIPFTYQLSAADFGGLDEWWINDTTNFAISNAGLITNRIPLSIGIYGLQVWVNDTSGNTLTATFSINVQGPLSPQPGIPGFPLTAILFGLAFGLSLGIISHRKRRKNDITT